MTSPSQKMTEDAFRDCLDRYGEDIRDWPYPEAAAGLLVESAEARGRLEEMKRLRSLFALGSPSGIKAPAGLAARIAAAAVQTCSDRPSVTAGHGSEKGKTSGPDRVSPRQVRFA